jgi:hypothetical protein
MCPRCGVNLVSICREDNVIIADKFRFIPTIRKVIKNAINQKLS